MADAATSILLPVHAVQAALDAIEDTVAIVGPDGGIVAVNEAWTRFMLDNNGDPGTCGVGVNYLSACDRAEGPSSDEGPPVARGVRDVLSGRTEQFSLEYPCHSPTEQRWYRVQVRPFESAGVRYATVVHVNVTEQRLTEIRAEDLDQEVAQGIQEKTADLRQENTELDAFIGAVSHDLRAPVRHLRGYLGILRRRAEQRLSDDDRRLLDILDGAAGRLAQMIDELLDLSRTSQTVLRVQPVDLNAVVRRAWTNLAPETEARRIDWVTGALPTVPGDPDLLRLAFENLLGNAIKYTAGRAQARIEVGVKREGHDWVVFVQDDGVGFDPRYTHRLFGAFQRLHDDKEFQGIGMGLVNVRRIIERHGGTVRAEGHPGDGATFYLRFPGADQSDTPPD